MGFRPGTKFSINGSPAIYEVTRLLPEYFSWYGIDMSNHKGDKVVVKLVNGNDVKFEQIAKNGECVCCLDCCIPENIVIVN